MNGGHFVPYHRNEKYPRRLKVDFKRVRLTTLKKYVRSYDVNVRPDCTASEFAIAVGRHFDSYLDVEEPDVLRKFMNYVKKQAIIDPIVRRSTRKEREAKLARRKRARKNLDSEEDEEEEAQPVVPGKMDPELYCFCRRGSFGYMIGCDDDDCAYEWFHLECVGLTPNTRPRGKWFCPECREAKEAAALGAYGSDSGKGHGASSSGRASATGKRSVGRSAKRPRNRK